MNSWAVIISVDPVWMLEAYRTFILEVHKIRSEAISINSCLEKLYSGVGTVLAEPRVFPKCPWQDKSTWDGYLFSVPHFLLKVNRRDHSLGSNRSPVQSFLLAVVRTYWFLLLINYYIYQKCSNIVSIYIEGSPISICLLVLLLSDLTPCFCTVWESTFTLWEYQKILPNT